MMDSIFISSLIKIVLKYLHCAINNEVIENKAVFKPHQRNEILIFVLEIFVLMFVGAVCNSNSAPYPPTDLNCPTSSACFQCFHPKAPVFIRPVCETAGERREE